MYKIEKDVPIPEARTRSAAYPWAEMIPGDSFLIPAETQEEKNSKRSSAIACGKRWYARHGIKWNLTTRAEENGIRVWIEESEENDG